MEYTTNRLGLRFAMDTFTLSEAFGFPEAGEMTLYYYPEQELVEREYIRFYIVLRDTRLSGTINIDNAREIRDFLDTALKKETQCQDTY